MGQSCFHERSCSTALPCTVASSSPYLHPSSAQRLTCLSRSPSVFPSGSSPCSLASCPRRGCRAGGPSLQQALSLLPTSQPFCSMLHSVPLYPFSFNHFHIPQHLVSQATNLKLIRLKSLQIPFLSIAPQSSLSSGSLSFIRGSLFLAQ